MRDKTEIPKMAVDSPNDRWTTKNKIDKLKGKDTETPLSGNLDKIKVTIGKPRIESTSIKIHQVKIIPYSIDEDKVQKLNIVSHLS